MKRVNILGLITLLVVAVVLIGACVSSAPPPAIEKPSPTPTAPGTLPVTPTPAPTPTPTPTPSPTVTGAAAQLQVHFINVGQGDSILLDSDDTEVLIDGGEKSPGVVSYLKNYVDGPLEVMVATHPHADHIGGLTAVLSAFQVQQIWHNGEKSDSKTYTEFINAVNAEGARIHVGKRGDKISAGNLTLTILNPRSLTGTTNNNSIVMSFSYGTVTFLFTGDAEKEAEGAMLVASDMPVPKVNVLKVGHHGSRTASSLDFLSLTKPEIAVYMAGVGNRYGHPHQETLATLGQIGAKIYGTDVNGSIIINTNGETYAVATKK